MTRLWLGAVLAATVSACGPPSGPSAEHLPKRGLQYWLDHPEERAEVLAECRESAAAEAEHHARFRATWGRRLDLEEQYPWRTSSSP